MRWQSLSILAASGKQTHLVAVKSNLCFPQMIVSNKRESTDEAYVLKKTI
jgi:hypothetical protein